MLFKWAAVVCIIIEKKVYLKNEKYVCIYIYIEREREREIDG